MDNPEEAQPVPHDRTAVAILYDPLTRSAPTIIATGKGEVAATIIRIAKENNVPLQSDPVLATALAGLDLGEQIPPELYRAVAEVLAFVYKLSAYPGLKATGYLPRLASPGAHRSTPPATGRG